MAPSPVRLPTTPGGRLVGADALKKLAVFGAFLALLFSKEVTKFIRGNAFGEEPHASEEEVGRKISAYLDGDLSLEELDVWLTHQTWDNEGAPMLAHRAELLIAEAGRGDRTDLANELRALAASSRDSVPA